MASSEGISFRWEAFNRWCDEYADRHQGMKPKVEDVRRWHRENAEKVWPDSSERPSVFLAVSHNKGRRVRGHKTCEYYKRYRAGKAAEQQLAARLQPAALSGRRILAVTAAARKLNTDCSRGVSKRLCHEHDGGGPLDHESLERAEKRRRMRSVPHDHNGASGLGECGGHRSSSDGDFSEDPSWASAEAASDEDDDSGLGSAGHLGHKGHHLSRGLGPLSSGPPRAQLHAGVHITVVRRDADGRTIQVQTQQTPAQAQSLLMSQAGGIPLAGGTAAVGLQSHFGLYPGKGAGCPQAVGNGAAFEHSTRVHGRAGGLGQGKSRSHGPLPRARGSSGSSEEDGTPDADVDEEDDQDGRGARGVEPAGQGWKRGGAQRRARSRPGDPGTGLAASDDEELEGQEGSWAEGGGSLQQARHGLREREPWGGRDSSRCVRHPGIAPAQCRGPRCTSSRSRSGGPGQPRTLPHFSGYVETPIGPMPVYNVGCRGSLTGCASGPDTAPAAKAAGRGGSRSSAGSGRPAGGLIPVASSKDPLDLLAQAACEALASPRPEIEDQGVQEARVLEPPSGVEQVSVQPAAGAGGVSPPAGDSDGLARVTDCGPSHDEGLVPPRGRADGLPGALEPQQAVPKLEEKRQSPAEQGLSQPLGGPCECPVAMSLCGSGREDATATQPALMAPVACTSAAKTERQEEPQGLGPGPVPPAQIRPGSPHDFKGAQANGHVAADEVAGEPCPGDATVMCQPGAGHRLPSPEQQSVLAAAQAPCASHLTVEAGRVPLPAMPPCAVTVPSCGVVGPPSWEPALVQAEGSCVAPAKLDAEGANPTALASQLLPATIPAAGTAVVVAVQPPPAAPALAAVPSCLDTVSAPFLALPAQPLVGVPPATTVAAATAAAAGLGLPQGLGLGLVDPGSDLARLAAAHVAGAGGANSAGAAALAAALLASQQQPAQQLLPALGLVEACPALPGVPQGSLPCAAGLDAAKLSLLAATVPGDPMQVSLQQQQQQQQQQQLLWQALNAGAGSGAALGFLPPYAAPAAAGSFFPSAPVGVGSVPSPGLDAAAAFGAGGYLAGGFAPMMRLLQLQMQAAASRPEVPLAGAGVAPGADPGAATAAAMLASHHAACSAMPPSLLDMAGLLGAPAAPTPACLAALARTLQQSSR